MIAKTVKDPQVAAENFVYPGGILGNAFIRIMTAMSCVWWCRLGGHSRTFLRLTDKTDTPAVFVNRSGTLGIGRRGPQLLPRPIKIS